MIGTQTLAYVQAAAVAVGLPIAATATDTERTRSAPAAMGPPDRVPSPKLHGPRRIPLRQRFDQLSQRKMIMNIKAIILGCALSTGLVSVGQADEPLKVGFVFVGSVGDGGWTYAHNQGRLTMQKALGDKVKSTYVENVPEGAYAERVIRQLAAFGNKISFA